MQKKDLTVIKHIGKGKSGNSYLAEYQKNHVVLKEMHDEEVPYYTFTKSKIEHELDSYQKLAMVDIKIPKLLFHSREHDYLIKEYIDGLTATQCIVNNALMRTHLHAMLRLEELCKASGINIDYFPSNFVIAGNDVYYIDYEFNTYSEEWNFRNWGIYYWLNNEGMEAFARTGSPDSINHPQSGKPLVSEALEEKRKQILGTFEASSLSPLST